MFYQIKKTKGFTLLEMIVSLGIFSFVAVIAVGALVRITSLNRQAQAMQSIVNNVNYTLESISREMRFGTNYYCGNESSFTTNSLTPDGCDPGDNVIAFNSSRVGTNETNPAITCQLVYAYWFSAGTSGTIKKAQQTYCDSVISADNAFQIIDPNNIVLTGYTLNVVPNTYSWATIQLVGHSGEKVKERNDFDVRTGISQRTVY